MSGFGDALFSATSSGSPPASVTGLYTALREHAVVVRIREHRTSITCSWCLANGQESVLADAMMPRRTWHGPPTLEEFQRHGHACWQTRCPTRGVQVGPHTLACGRRCWSCPTLLPACMRLAANQPACLPACLPSPQPAV